MIKTRQKKKKSNKSEKHMQIFEKLLLTDSYALCGYRVKAISIEIWGNCAANESNRGTYSKEIVEYYPSYVISPINKKINIDQELLFKHIIKLIIINLKKLLVLCIMIQYNR